MNFKNIFRKNQMMIYAMAFMLVVAGYFNYTANIKETETEVETSVQEVSNGDIGDAVTEENSVSPDAQNTTPFSASILFIQE